MNREYVKHKIEHNTQRFFIAVKWVICAVLSGVLVGLVGAAFCICMNFVNGIRTNYPAIILLLPFAGMFIVGIYHLFHNEKDTGTNLVISAIHSDDRVPLRMAPSIFISTIITHLFGGSAGREGAALQLGGSIGGSLSRLLRLDEKDTHVMIMCGMSAAFAALFGTPMAAAIFSMEVVSVGVMYYAALVPCVIAALIGNGITSYFGLSEHIFHVSNLPEFTIRGAVITSILAILCALVSMLFCILLHSFGHGFKKHIANPYLRAFIGGLLVVILTFFVGNQDYNSTGMHVIERALNGNVVPVAFLLKMIFTAITLGCGFKGGEIVPSFFIGACFGCLFGNLTGFSPVLCTAVGMVSVFCGVTNCPISSLLISFEMFGFEGMPFYLLACAFSYMLSGYFGLYNSQKIMYSKFHTTFINKETH
ncbi:MAG: chloride channel protein [Lachnospiraceae bacterium]|nr:chloride channel protein [Lachnospiraceae bacterium]